jgi:hypothetical protein
METLEQLTLAVEEVVVLMVLPQMVIQEDQE